MEFQTLNNGIKIPALRFWRLANFRPKGMSKAVEDALLSAIV